MKNKTLRICPNCGREAASRDFGPVGNNFICKKCNYYGLPRGSGKRL